MKKIVLKARVRGQDEFEERLERAGVELGPVYWQHDRIYCPRGYRRGGNYPRFVLRTEMKAVDRPAKYSLILKRHIEDADVEVEFKTEVKDYTEAAGMVMQLGFEPKAEVAKRRQEAKLKDATLYLDRVEKLNGYFVKVEAEVSEGEKVEAARVALGEKLKQVMEFSERSLVRETYGEM